VASEPPGRSDPILGSATGGDLLGFATKSGGNYGKNWEHVWKTKGLSINIGQTINRNTFFLRKMRMNHKK
jgi:hypothetical protein